MKAALSWGVWNLPWPNLELVSMNLRLIFSRALFLVWVRRDFLRVRVLFLGPMQQPFEVQVSKVFEKLENNLSHTFVFQTSKEVWASWVPRTIGGNHEC